MIKLFTFSVGRNFFLFLIRHHNHTNWHKKKKQMLGDKDEIYSPGARFCEHGYRNPDGLFGGAFATALHGLPLPGRPTATHGLLRFGTSVTPARIPAAGVRKIACFGFGLIHTSKISALSRLVVHPLLIQKANADQTFRRTKGRERSFRKKRGFKNKSVHSFNNCVCFFQS